jgi:hypothetical protein
MRLSVMTLACAVLLTCAVPSRAEADEPPTADSAAEARQQYQMGTQAFQAKRYSEAALHFEAAAAFRAHAVALYTAGLAWDNAARPERAADAYARSLDVSGLDPKQTAMAKERLAQLEKTLGTVVVTSPEGWKVQLDTFTEVATPARLHASPGVHALTIRAPLKPIERRDVSLEPGKVVNLELRDEGFTRDAPPEAEPKAEIVPAPPPPQPELKPPFWNVRKAAGVGVLGVGVAALGGAVVLGLSANDARDAYNDAPTRHTFDHASSLETWTNVALVSGAVLALGGLALFLFPEKDAPRARASLRTSGLGGKF